MALVSVPPAHGATRNVSFTTWASARRQVRRGRLVKSGLLPDGFDQQVKWLGALRSAWIIEKEARNGRGVGFEHAPKSPRAELLRDQRLEHVREPKPLLCPLDAQQPIVRDHRSSDWDSPSLSTALELPCVERARGVGPEREALVVEEVLRALRSAALFEVARSAYDHEAKGIGEPNAHHVALDVLAQPNPGVVALGNDVDAAILERELELDAGVALSKCRQHRLDHERECRPRHGEPHSTHYLSWFRRDLVERRARLGERGTGHLEQPSPGVRDRHAPRRARDEDYAKLLLELTHALAQRRARDAQLAGAPGEALRARDGEERLELSEGDCVHEVLYIVGRVTTVKYG